MDNVGSGWAWYAASSDVNSEDEVCFEVEDYFTVLTNVTLCVTMTEWPPWIKVNRVKLWNSAAVALLVLSFPVVNRNDAYVCECRFLHHQQIFISTCWTWPIALCSLPVNVKVLENQVLEWLRDRLPSRFHPTHVQRQHKGRRHGEVLYITFPPQFPLQFPLQFHVAVGRQKKTLT